MIACCFRNAATLSVFLSLASPTWSSEAAMSAVQLSLMTCLRSIAGTAIAAPGSQFEAISDVKTIDQRLLNPAFGTPQVARHVSFGEPGQILLIATPDVRACTVVVTGTVNSEPLQWMLAFLNGSGSPFKLDQAESKQSESMISARFVWAEDGRTPVSYVVTGPKDPALMTDAPQAIATVAFVSK